MDRITIQNPILILFWNEQTQSVQWQTIPTNEQSKNAKIAEIVGMCFAAAQFFTSKIVVNNNGADKQVEDVLKEALKPALCHCGHAEFAHSASGCTICKCLHYHGVMPL